MVARPIIIVLFWIEFGGNFAGEVKQLLFPVLPTESKPRLASTRLVTIIVSLFFGPGRWKFLTKFHQSIINTGHRVTGI